MVVVDCEIRLTPISGGKVYNPEGNKFHDNYLNYIFLLFEVLIEQVMILFPEQNRPRITFLFIPTIR
jgi:hypothetical protein